MIDAALEAKQRSNAERAAELYIQSLSPASLAADWRKTNEDSRMLVENFLNDSDHLRDVGAAIGKNGFYLQVVRNACAPPISQDQFKLRCSEYPKNSEKSGKGVQKNLRHPIADAFMKWRDRDITAWLDENRDPTPSERSHIIQSVASMLSVQLAATRSRTFASSEQEDAVVTLLRDNGWLKRPSALIETLSEVPVKNFMHKTKFATRTLPQEVDIACGLGGTVVLAMECKVTNDLTNSVKRVNDILKKAAAWHDHWGSFVKTAALLQGVVAFKDVRRLLAGDVLVFWSHSLSEFDSWLERNLRGS